MYPVSQAFLDTITASHRIAVRATAYLGGAVVPGGEDLLVAEGSVRVDGKSKVRRQAEGLRFVTRDGKTSTLRAVLEPPGTELQIWRGVTHPSGTDELAPLGRFRVGEVSDSLAVPGTVVVTGADRSSQVAADRFLAPRAGDTTKTIPAQIAALIQESVPGVTVTDHSGSAQMVAAGVVWERERWDAIEELANSIGCVVFADPEGSFVIEPQTDPAAPADWTVLTGEGGVLLDGDRRTTLDGVYNVVVATSSPTDGTAPSYGYAEDTNAASPTRVSGPMGRVPRFYSSPLLATDAQALSAAQSILARAIGRRGSLDVTSLVNPALDAGDRIDVVLPDGSTRRHVVDSFAVPLSPTGSMTLATRTTDSTEAETL